LICLVWINLNDYASFCWGSYRHPQPTSLQLTALEDSESAILLLSAIIGQPIETLEFLPQEGSSYLKNHSLTVYRVDFSAKIKTDENEFKQVIIEIQKAKLPSDIMRFRRYLGE